MPNANGVLSIFGQQYNVPPFDNIADQLYIPYSPSSRQFQIASGESVSLLSAIGDQGLIIIPSGGGSITFTLGIGSNPYNLSPTFVSVFAIDPNNPLQIDIIYAGGPALITARFF